MAKIKEIRFDFKKGLPGFSSIAVGLTASVEENEDLDKVFDELRDEAEKQASLDPSWINRD